MPSQSYADEATSRHTLGGVLALTFPQRKKGNSERSRRKLEPIKVHDEANDTSRDLSSWRRCRSARGSSASSSSLWDNAFLEHSGQAIEYSGFYRPSSDTSSIFSSVQAKVRGGSSRCVSAAASAPSVSVASDYSRTSRARCYPASCDVAVSVITGVRRHRRAMGVFIALAVAAMAGLMYKVPVMQRADIKRIDKALHSHVYCQQEAVDSLMKHIQHYASIGHKGPVLLFLSGPEGSGKTHTINTLLEVNPTWTKIIATHEQGHFNQMEKDELVSAVRAKLHSSILNFIFVDDVPSLHEGTSFVELKLKPLLKSLKFDDSLVFVVITRLSWNGKAIPPAYLRDEYEYQVVPYRGMNRSCVTRCVLDVILALDGDLRRVDLEGLLDQFDMVRGIDGQQVSVDGCKSAPIKVAIYMVGDPPDHDDDDDDDEKDDKNNRAT